MRCVDETVFMKLLLGELSPEETAEVDAHLDTCAACRTLVAEGLRAQSPDVTTTATPTEPQPPSTLRRDDSALEKGTAVGRYLVLELLGAGAMGVVYGAYDPELDRRVALKLLRTGALGLDVEKERAHLLREAQAMARVSHPNVVAVYDVGTFGQHVFLAMERVEAQTLGEWLKAAPRPWREVLDLFLDAGRGLAAAHAAGVVHGDFKPANLLVGGDDNVHVTDFGLARLGASTTRESSLPARADPQVVERSLTGGTPAYMAPEQLLGETRAGASGDQFSFCVALHEALYGARPFEGTTLAELATQVSSGQVRPPPAGTRVPPWLRRVLLRGLSRRAEDRFPHLQALLDALQKDPAARWKRGLQLTGAVAVLATAVGLTHAVHTSGARACASAPHEMTTVWSPEQASAIQAAFTATGRPYASAAWERVRRELDAYTAAWTTTRTTACEATRVRGEQPEEVMAWRMRCLDNRLADVSALTRLLSQADARTVDESHRAVKGLPPLSGCSEALAPGGATLPEGPEARERHAALRATLARGRALLATGRYAEGVTLVEPTALAAKRAANRHDGAEISLLLGELREGAGDWRGAETSLFEALNAAEATRQDAVAARAWTLLVRVSCIGLDEYELASRWKDRAAAAIERLGGGNELTRVNLLTYSGTVLRKQRRFDEAVALQEQALLIAESTFGPDSLEVADVLLELGATQWVHPRLAEARAHLERAATITRQALGDEHPEVARVRLAVVPVLRDQDDLKLAELIAREALGVFERTLGPDHPRVYDALNDLASTLVVQSRMDEALPLYERALTIVAKTDGAESFGASVIHANLGVLYFHKNLFDPSLEHFLRTITLRDKSRGLMDPSLVSPLRLAGKIMSTKQRYADMLHYCQRAVDIMLLQPDDSSGQWTLSLRDLGTAFLKLDRPAEALVPLERAVAGWDKATPGPGQRTEVKFLLAQALWESGKDRARALKLVAEARTMAMKDDPSEKTLPLINEWLAKHKLR
ncbi:tetratricopeptide repeat protein [Myxococcus qinghaiensis]|uniref:tetratricopeptide repeat protein n=1 Tax=Myxococcus qinghaiensis TaxID=2906758 RepID=UPI0020A6E3F4|nr:tetratricopeptide repeat protein [Myxococcus qinghaiensis]MCP3169665.1 tetratricopeptide repeat protein [Myxococcus qinghaiensis]